MMTNLLAALYAIHGGGRAVTMAPVRSRGTNHPDKLVLKRTMAFEQISDNKHDDKKSCCLLDLSLQMM